MSTVAQRIPLHKKTRCTAFLVACQIDRQKSAVLTEHLSISPARPKSGMMTYVEASFARVELVTISVVSIQVVLHRKTPPTWRYVCHRDQKGDWAAKRRGPRLRCSLTNGGIININNTIQAEGMTLFIFTSKPFVVAGTAWATGSGGSQNKNDVT